MKAYDKPKLEEEEIKLEDIIAVSQGEGDGDAVQARSIISVFGGM